MANGRAPWTALLLVLLIGHEAVSNPDDLPKSAKVLDQDCIFYSWPYPTISPDGAWISYVSRGYVCICNVNDPAPRKVMEVPHSRTWPHLTVKRGGENLIGSFGEFRGLSRDEYRELNAQVTRTVYGLIWTHDSTGFVFAVQSYDAVKRASTSDTYFSTVEGQVTMLAHIGPEAKARGIVVGSLTRDGNYLVSSTQSAHPGYRPLIWDVRKNKPRATCYLYLTPSSTSDRWIGIEKDTRQLVLVDAQFDVIKRFDERVPDRTFGFRLDWSPDERFIIWRNQIGFDHYNNWDGFQLDLNSGFKRELEGRFMDELLIYTGRGGEFFRSGQDGIPSKAFSGDVITGAHLTIVPEGDMPPQDLWRITVNANDPKPGMLTNRPGNPPVRMSPDGTLFAIGIPRPAGERSGCVWHLINRDGRMWRFPGEDNGQYVSPYELAGFADDGKMVVAYDASRLFSMPISEIMIDANEAKK